MTTTEQALNEDAYAAYQSALSAAKAVSEPKACDMGAMCLDCQPRGKNGECPDQQPQAQGEDKLRETVATVLEGWTIPDGVRKMLETAYWSHPQASEPAPEATK